MQAARDQPLNHKNYDGVTHEFFGVGAVVDEAKGAQQFAAAELKKRSPGEPAEAVSHRIPNGVPSVRTAPR